MATECYLEWHLWRTPNPPYVSSEDCMTFIMWGKSAEALVTWVQQRGSIYNRRLLLFKRVCSAIFILPKNSLYCFPFSISDRRNSAQSDHALPETRKYIVFPPQQCDFSYIHSPFPSLGILHRSISFKHVLPSPSLPVRWASGLAIPIYLPRTPRENS